MEKGQLHEERKREHGENPGAHDHREQGGHTDDAPVARTGGGGGGVTEIFGDNNLLTVCFFVFMLHMMHLLMRPPCTC